jgi:hypothetical protein
LRRECGGERAAASFAFCPLDQHDGPLHFAG